MTRKSLCLEIQFINQRLNLRQAQLQLANVESKTALKQIKPYSIIGIGLFAGVMTSILPWRSTYSLVNTCFSLYPFLIRSTNRLMSMRNE